MIEIDREAEVRVGVGRAAAYRANKVRIGRAAREQHCQEHELRTLHECLRL